MEAILNPDGLSAAPLQRSNSKSWVGQLSQKFARSMGAPSDKKLDAYFARQSSANTSGAWGRLTLRADGQPEEFFKEGPIDKRSGKGTHWKDRCATPAPEPYTLNPTSHTLHATPSPYILHPTPSTPAPSPVSTLPAPAGVEG